MGPPRTTKLSIRRRHRHRHSTPPLSDHSPSYDHQRATSSSHDHNKFSNYSPSVCSSAAADDDDSLYKSPASAYSSNYLCDETLQGYVPVVPLPVFRGKPDECPFAHLLRFDCVCRVNNAAAPAFAAHIFPASLHSYAGIWYDIFIDPSLPWEDIRSAFLSAFQPPDFSNKSRTELVSLRQYSNETVTRYYVRMLWILKKWPEHGMSDDILKGIFIDGLREELKEQVATQRLVTLDEAVSLAASWEQAVDIREAQRKALKIVRCNFCGVDGHELNSCEVRQGMKELWASKGNGSSERRDSKVQAENTKTLMAVLNRSDSARSSVQCQCQRHQCLKKAEADEL